MDVLVPTTMKNAVKCDTSCESQNPVSHQNFERNLHFLGSMTIGVPVFPTYAHNIRKADRYVTLFGTRLEFSSRVFHPYVSCV